jgi:hypothetical protein
MPRTIDDMTPCEGCGSYHGSVGGELACLRTKLRETREARDLLLQAHVVVHRIKP